MKTNLKEFESVCGKKLNPADRDFKQKIAQEARIVMEKYNIGNLLITLSKDGMIFIPSDKESVEFAIGTLPEVAFSIGSFNVYWGSICRSIKIILRLFMMFELTTVLTTTTS